MFDLRDDDLTRRQEMRSPLPQSEPPPGAGEQQQGGVNGDPPNPLDAPQNVELYHRLLDSYTRELDRQEENREQMAADEDFYDNIQWSDTDAQALDDRGQKPLVYNVISTTVNWVLGTEKRGRSDFKVLPRRKEDGKPAERKSQVLKYLSDCNRTPFHRSRAFADAVKVGLGWLEDCYEDVDGDEPLVSRYESWRNMLWDSAASNLDLTDSRYVFRSKWVDLDIMQTLLPKRAGLLETSASSTELLVPTGMYGDEAMDRAELELDRVGSTARLPNRYARGRLRVIEGWFRKPDNVTRLSGSLFGGEIYDPNSPGHQYAVRSGYAEPITRAGLRMHCALFTINGLLWLGPSPYRHNRFPFTPVWGNRRGRDGLPYGLIRGLRDIQEDINKRASKALFLLSVNRTIADEGAVEDMDELQDEAARPDAFIVKKAGKEVKIEQNSQLAEAHVDLMARSISMVQQASGVTDENLGRKTNATAGIAIERRQVQGAMATTHYFDNLRLAFQIQGEKQLSLVEQFMGDKKEFRITSMRGSPEYATVNDGLPENDIVRSKADFIISESDWRASMREAASAELFDLLNKLAPAAPQLVLVLLDLLVEDMDISNRDEIVRRIRDMSGQRDPDAEEPTPEEQERMAAAAKQQQMTEATQEAGLRKLVAEAAKTEAEADKAIADKVRAIIASMGGPKRGAVDLAADLMTSPQIAPAADAIMRDAGYVSRTEQEVAAAVKQRAEAVAQAQQQQALQQQAQGQQQQEQQQQEQPPQGAQPQQQEPQQPAQTMPGIKPQPGGS